MSHQDTAPTGKSKFRKVLNIGGSACILMGVIVIIMVATSFLAGQNAAQTVPTLTAHSNCELVSKEQTVGYKEVIESVDTSCGTFRVSSELYELMEEDKVYNLTSTHHELSNTSYISSVTETK